MSDDLADFVVSRPDRAFTETYSATQDVVDMVDYLRKAMDLSKSEVVRKAIREMYDRAISSVTPPSV